MAQKAQKLSLYLFDTPINECSGPAIKAYITDLYFHIASFPNVRAMTSFFKRFGLTMKFNRTIDDPKNGKIREYLLNERFQEEGYFWKRQDVPEDAQPIKLLSNGSLVTGYVKRIGDIIHVWRPNPNAKEVFDEMPLNARIEYKRNYGIF